MAAHQYNFLEASRVGKVPDATLSFHCTRSALATFQSNVELAMGVSTIPGFTFWMAQEWFAASLRAHRDVAGTTPVESLDQATLNFLGVTMEKYMREAMALNRDRQVQHLIERTTMFEKFSMDAGKPAQECLNGLLKSILVQSATAFEVLTGDLHKGARNEKPSSFPSFPAEKSGPRFTSRDMAQTAYRQYFTTDRIGIDGALKNDAVNAIFLTRNVILHKASRYDGEFIKYGALNSLLASLAPFDVDRELLLDGLTVSKILNGVFFSWFSTNP